MPLIQWIMQNLQPRPQGSALLGGSASISLEYQFPNVGEAGGAILGAETADVTTKRIFRKLIRFIPGDIAFDVCTNQRWTILSYYFDLNGYVKYLASNNIQQVEFFEEELEIERSSIRKNYLQAKKKTEYLQSLASLEIMKQQYVPLSEGLNFAIFKFLPGDIVFDVYHGKKWHVMDYYIDLNHFNRYLVTDGNNKLEYLEDELQISKPRIKQNCDLTETEDEYTKAQNKIDYLQTHFSPGPSSPAYEIVQAVFKYMPGETVYDVYKKQRWQVLESHADINGEIFYTVSNRIVKKIFTEKELQTEKLAMKALYAEAQEKISFLQG
jgi:hypothetical protein